MPVDWKKIFSFAAEIPVVKRAIGATLEELHTNPEFQKFVERYQAMNANTASNAASGVTQAECMICLFSKYGREHGLTTNAAPRHRCIDHAGGWFP